VIKKINIFFNSHKKIFFFENVGLSGNKKLSVFLFKFTIFEKNIEKTLVM